MTAGAATARTARTGRPASLGEGFAAPEEVVVGRDVLELISSAMYVDPMTIFREYIQNAADAVDAARRNGTLGTDEPGLVEIDVDGSARTIRIRDNGTGVRRQDFVRCLTAIGASGKRNTSARGFRGVGRLAGLGYAQELVFRSRVDGEPSVSELRWDCRALRAALRQAEGEGGVADVVRRVVTAGLVEAEGRPERFFEVELRGVIRIKSDKLLNPAAIADYVAQVAPVPFSPAFRFGAEIMAALLAVGCPRELEVRVSGIEGAVHRPHRDTFPINEARLATFGEVEFVEVNGMDGGLAGLAWLLHHDYEGAIPAAAQVKGLRLRSGNIQVGDNALLEELFPETRFNGWAVGEVHVLDRRIVPNGRRDHFEQNAHLHNLINQLAPSARKIARLCRPSLVRRKWLRQFELLRGQVEAGLATLAQRGGGPRQRTSIAFAAEQALAEMERIGTMELLADDEPELMKGAADELRARLSRELEGADAGASMLARLPKKKQLMYEHLFELIYECWNNKP